jgi:hypothetical protein
MLFQPFRKATRPETPGYIDAETQEGLFDARSKEAANALRSQNITGAASLYNSGMGDRSPIADSLFGEEQVLDPQIAGPDAAVGTESPLIVPSSGPVAGAGMGAGAEGGAAALPAALGTESALIAPTVAPTALGVGAGAGTGAGVGAGGAALAAPAAIAAPAAAGAGTAAASAGMASNPVGWGVAAALALNELFG